MSHHTIIPIKPPPTTTFRDYDHIFSKLPIAAIELHLDSAFCRWRLAGPNPVTIAPCTAEMLSSKANIDSLPVPVQAWITTALADNRLYICDYTALATLKGGIYANQRKYSLGPIALFSIPVDEALRTRQSLEPLAIQCEHIDPHSPTKPVMFHPGDDEEGGWSWKIAKAVINWADGNYHEAVVHLAHTHLLVEPFVVATQRTLPLAHPLHHLLLPHFEGTSFINHAADKQLINPDGPVDKLFSPDIHDLNSYVGQQVRALLASDFSFPGMLQRRGMDVKGFPAPYPYRDDGMLVWSAIHGWVGDYLRVYYGEGEAAKKAIKVDPWVGILKPVLKIQTLIFEIHPYARLPTYRPTTSSRHGSPSSAPTEAAVCTG